jgi:hypothetical protein
MFLLNFIPDAFLLWVVNAVLIAGIAGTVVAFFFGFFVRYLPWIIPYRMVLQVVGLVLLIAGVYFKGGVGVEMEWRARAAEMEAKVAKAEAESKVVNEVIVEKIVEKIRVVKEKETIIQEKIVNVAVTIDSQCKVLPEAIEILNSAAKKSEVKK